jgi:nitroreductase
MNEIIRKRKSIRKYEPAKLDEATLEKVRQKIAGVTPLYPEIRYSIQIVDRVKRAYGINAPYFLQFRSEEKEGAGENIGFVGQQLDLFFSGTGLGSCWVGMAKPDAAAELGELKERNAANENTAIALPYVISMAFGKPAEPLHRTIDQFIRKPLSDISEGADPRLEAARLAPSGINAQNWHFIADAGKIHCYRRKANPLLEMMLSKLGRIDMGIAICHLAMESPDFRFAPDNDAPVRKACVYAGTVTPTT